MNSVPPLSCLPLSYYLLQKRHVMQISKSLDSAGLNQEITFHLLFLQVLPNSVSKPLVVSSQSLREY